MRGWRSLGLFWLGVVILGGGGAATLQVMGPPRPAVVELPAVAGLAVAPVSATVPAPAAAPRPSGNVADPALLEPAPDLPGAFLPRIGPGGRAPMQVYAARVNAGDHRPRVAFLIAGIGQSGAESRAAIDALPPAVTLGVSPYTPDPAPLVAAARALGHEVLVTLPMESQGYPLNGSGPHALLTGANPADNLRNLHWVLSRVPGAAGVTGASDGLRGERFAGSGALFGPVLQELAARGLIYVDARDNAAVRGGTLAITSVVDDPPQRAAIDARLAALEQAARDGKPALGLAGQVSPVTVDRVASWARGLDGRGIALVPVTALAPHGPAP